LAPSRASLSAENSEGIGNSACVRQRRLNAWAPASLPPREAPGEECALCGAQVLPAQAAERAHQAPNDAKLSSKPASLPVSLSWIPGMLICVGRVGSADKASSRSVVAIPGPGLKAFGTASGLCSPGIEMTIVRRPSEQIGAAIKIDSCESGTVARLRFPVVAPSSARPRAHTDDNPNVASAQSRYALVRT
jgi:hypothetical protein